MEPETFPFFDLSGLTLVSAKVINIGAYGELTVKTDEGRQTFKCKFVRTSKGALPSIHLRSEVLCAVDENRGEKGYVIGVIEDDANTPKSSSDIIL